MASVQQSRLGASSSRTANRHHLTRKMTGVCAFALSLGLLGSAAWAQQTQSDASNRPLEEIQITGSRIISTGMTTPTPVTSLQATELFNMSPGNLVDTLGELPQFFNNQSAESSNGGANSGGSNLNLRGAGANRTLVLLDGRRVVPSNRYDAVDVGIFPKELIRNIETVTGGASASYGTDAVAGVVNFILDTDFTGIKGHVQGGETQYADGKNFEAGLAFGTDLGSRAHIIGSYEYSNAQPIDSFSSLKKRKWVKQWAAVTNPAHATDPSTPLRIIRPYVSPTNFSNNGILLTAKGNEDSPLNHLEFQPDGSVAPLSFSGVGSLNGGCLCQAENSQSYGVNKDSQIQAGSRRASGFLYLDYDVSDNVQLYLQGMYGHNRIDSRWASISWVQSWATQVQADNYYLPQAVKDEMVKEGLSSIGYGMLGLNGPDTPLGDNRQITSNTMYSGTVGFKSQIKNGGFMDSWHIDGYYQYGRNNQSYDDVNGIRLDRLALSLDAVADPATGQPVCYAATIDPEHFGDCVPMNPFGGVQNISQAAAGYITDDYKHAVAKIRQHAAELVATGNIWDGWGAGPISGALGASYRKETLNQSTPDPTDEFPAFPNGTLLSDAGLLPVGVRGLIPEGKPNGIPGLRYVSPGYTGDANSSVILFSSVRTIKGGYNVKEGFGELNIPILANLDFAKSMTASLAARYADYSGSGGIWAWKVGLDWQMISDLRFRATLSRDVRAATLRERFDQTRGGVNVNDPVNGGESIGAASFSGGNENVDPEKATTITVGTVFTPTFLSGLSVSLDWYRINTKDAIAQLQAQDIVDGCFDGDQSLCQYVHRDDTNHINRVDNLFINLSNQRISGVDLETSYRSSLTLFGGGAESVGIRFFGSYLAENSVKDPGAARDDSAGQSNFPKWKATANLTYANGPASVFVTERWTDGGTLNRRWVEGVDVDNNHVKAIYYTDLHLGYAIGDSQQINLFADITNVFNKDPSIAAAQSVGRTGIGLGASQPSDTVGRRFVLGLKFQY